MSRLDYPKGYGAVMSLYAEAYTITDYLILLGGKDRYLQIPVQAKRVGWDRAFKQIYGIDGVRKLESFVVSWVDDGRPILDPIESPETAAVAVSPEVVDAGMASPKSRKNRNKTIAGMQLIYFTSKFCGPCREMTPVIDKLSQEPGFPEITKISLDTADEEQFVIDGRSVTGSFLVDMFGIDRAPVLIYAFNGKKVNRINGFADEPMIRAGINVRSRRPEKPISGKARAATVRVHVAMGNLRDIGTGTVVSSGDRSVILTCAHIFSEADDSSLIRVVTYCDGCRKFIPAELIDSDKESDLATIVVDEHLPSVQAGKLTRDCFTYGCSDGADPTLEYTSVLAVDRYDGPGNLLCSGAPAQGRSGGGLYNGVGDIVGVCSAADRRANEGLYTSIEEAFALKGFPPGYNPVYPGQPSEPDRTVELPPVEPESKIDWSTIRIVALVRSDKPDYVDLLGGPAERLISSISDGATHLEVISEEENADHFNAVMDAAGVPRDAVPVHVVVMVGKSAEVGFIKGLVLKKIEGKIAQAIPSTKLPITPDVVFERTHRRDWNSILDAIGSVEQNRITKHQSWGSWLIAAFMAFISGMKTRRSQNGVVSRVREFIAGAKE